ncbi:hypothetical protein B7463_g9439, partial [Scytalidium lignicola]
MLNMNRIFEIQPIGRFVGASAAIRRPKEMTCFSYDENHEFRLDNSGIKYYYPPSLGADLSKGFETFRKLNDTPDEHLDSLLKTIIAHEQSTGKKVEADVITWRGMMSKIMGSIFSDRDGFIEENHSYKLRSQARQSQQAPQRGRPSRDMMSYWGYKFETLSLLPATWDETSRDYIERRENEIVNNHAQYCSVVRTGIGNTSIVIGGEVDGVWDEKPSDGMPANWIELKTSAEIRNDRDMISFERKLMKFWIQSFLLGVPKIIVGFRSQDGILQRIEEIETAMIPSNVKRRGRGTWDGNMCINFAAAFLDFLRETIKGDGVWKIRRREASPVIEIQQVEETGHGDIISDEFINWRIKLLMSEKKSASDKDLH